MPDVGGIAGAQLKSFIERIERLEEEKRALGEDIKEVYAEAKGTGFEPKIMRQILPQDPKNGQGRARRAGESARHLQTRARNAARRRRNGSGRGIATPISTVVLRWRPYPTPCDASSEGVPIRSYWITIQLHHQSNRCHETRTN